MEERFKRLAERLDEILAQLAQLKSENQRLKMELDHREAQRIELLKRIDSIIDRLGMFE